MNKQKYTKTHAVVAAAVKVASQNLILPKSVRNGLVKKVLKKKS